MKKVCPILFYVCLFLGLRLADTSAKAATLVTTNSQASGQNWNALIWKTNVTDGTALAPVAGNAYVTLDNNIPFANNANNTRLRNPAAAGLQTFPGDTLTLNTNTEIRMKTAGATLNFPGVSGNAGLILNGGCLNTGDATTNFNIAGRINVVAPSVFDFGNPTFGVIDTTRGAIVSAALTGSGSLTLETANSAASSALVLLATNTAFQGDWNICGGYLKAVATNSLGFGNLIIGSTRTFGGAVPSTARAELMYDINTPGSLVISNNGQFFLHQNCAFRRVIINSTNLPAGPRTFAQLSAAYPNNFVAGGSGGITVFGPLNLLAAAGNSQVNLSWTGSAGATNYVILRSLSSGGPYTRIATNATTSYLDTTVSPNGTYYFAVLAQDSLGETAQSVEALASPPPLAPTNLTALAGNGRVTLYWNAALTATNYYIKRGTTSGGPFTTIATATASTFSDNTVLNDNTYYYVVSAANASGEGSNSAEVGATPSAAPTGLAGVGGNLQISLDWDDYPGALGYTLRRAGVSGGPYAVVATGISSSDFIDSTALSGRSYFYVVAAQLPGGESGYSVEATALTVPGAPLNVLAAPLTHTAVAVSWTPADPIVAGYKLEQSANGINFSQIASLPANQTSLPITGLLAQTSYSFRVRATNASGDSPYSAVATIITPLFGAQVNFQDTNSYALPAAFVPDGGMAFGDRTNTYTYGWDVDNTANGRRRANTAITNILLDSFSHMQKQYPPRIWEIAVPNGAYRVNLLAGDANTTGSAANVDSLPRLDVEGVLMLTGVPTTNAPFVSSSNNSVFVTDGRLTLSVDPSVTNTTFSYTDSLNVVRSGNIAANNKIS
ncbi:MAG TPA: fibronectin type III domain-containing protein, partial [Candidatus Saccharimonadales bacterium]|nr:fibronectin type III domain-containing protein [Candidatus Saccharimonadales bacterium]